MEVLELISLSGDDEKQHVYTVTYEVRWREGVERREDDYVQVDEVLKSVGGTSQPMHGSWVVRSTRDDQSLVAKIATELRKRKLSCSWVDFLLAGTGMDCVFVLRWN